MAGRINYKRIQDVLLEPREILPFLSEYDTQLLLIDMLRAYKRRMIDFQTLATVTEAMRFYTSPTTELWETLRQIRELNKEHEAMERVLKEMLKELQMKTIK